MIDPRNDVAFLAYSSGTTGLPKGVMLTHENMVCNLQQLRVSESAELDWKGGPDGQGDKVMGFLPFYHVFGQLPHVFSDLRWLLNCSPQP